MRMRIKEAAQISVLTTLLFLAEGQASAMTILNPPEPDIRLSFAESEADYGVLRKSIMGFAASERLAEFQNSPRAKGKAFFLSVYRDDLGNFIAEKKSVSSVVVIECTNLGDHTARGNYLFRDAVNHLEKILKAHWPNISVSQKRDDDEPGFKFIKP
jgi:hypothetical protein